MQFTTYKNRRWNGVEAFINPILSNPNFTVETGATVQTLNFEGERCCGVNYLQDGQQKTAHCDGEVLLAAGAYNSPKLMMLSGLGPALHLQHHGIKTIVDLKGVGEDLQDHHEVPVVAATNGHFGYFGEDKGFKALRNGLQYLLFGTGPVTSTGVEACAYIDPEGGDRPTLKMYCVPSVYLDGDVKGATNQDGVTINACLLRPKSRGTVRLRSGNVFDRPIIDNNYLAEPEDLKLEIAGLKFARRMLAAQPLAGRIHAELLPGAAITSDADLAEHCKRTVKTNWHPVGTCRMGKDSDDYAVLDTRLRVRGVSGLRVIDASAMPFVPSGNTNAPTMALADRAISLLSI